MQIWRYLGLLALCATGAMAEGLTAQDKARLLKDRAGFLEAAATATHWFGDPRGLSLQAVEDYVAAARAKRRADVLALLAQADLSDDGVVGMDEVLRLAPSLSPNLRGRLIATADQADIDHDGRLSQAEQLTFARAEALRLYPDQKARDLRLILLFDGDGDGWVTYAEVVQKLKDLAA